MGRTMEHITVAGRPEPIPASEVAARLLRQRLETVREERGADAADALEALIGARLGTLLEEGKPSIDVANMKAVADYAEVPGEEDNASGGERGRESTSLNTSDEAISEAARRVTNRDK